MSRLLALALALVLLLPPLAAQAAEEVPAAAREAFVRDRDAPALIAALDEAGVPAGDGWRGLAHLAGERMPPAMPREAEGPAALAAAVLALRRLDLAEAQRVLRGAGPDGGRAAVWLRALLHLRRGDDGGAVGALLAPPVFEPTRDAFPLALLGAALDPEDRRLLAAGARIALERAAARGRVPALRGAALGAAVLDPDSGARTLTYAVRALRRMGELDVAAELVALAPRAGVPVIGTVLALEAALLAWVRDERAAIPSLLTGSPPDGVGSVWLALRRAGRRPRTEAIPRGWRDEPSLRAHAAVTARLATALGRPTSTAEVASWARRARRQTWHADAMRDFLEAQQFAVESVAGDPAVGDALLRAGLPFVVLRLAPDGRGWRERPAVVHAYDRHTGLWLLDAPDAHGLDVMPRSEAAKVRILAAAPLGRHGSLAPARDRPATRLGRVLEQALARADRGELDEAVQDLEGAAGGEPVAWLYVAWLHHRRVLSAGGDEALRAAAAAAARSRRVPPALGLEAYLLGARDGADGDVDAALAAFRTATRLDGPNVTVQLAAFVAELAGGRRDEALASLERARQADPTEVAVLFHRGTLRAAAGEGVLARRDFRRALDRRPASLGVAVALARLDVQEGRYEEALEVLRATRRRDAKLANDPILEKAMRTAELEWIRNAGSVEALRGMRRSASPDTRRLLAYELARRSAEPDAAEAELREILGDEDEQVRHTALQVYMRPWLRRRIQEDAVLLRRIGTLLGEDPSLRVRSAAAAVLGRVPADQARRLLAEAVHGPKADAAPTVRVAAALGLANHDALRTHEVLVAALEDDSVDVRRAAAGSLFRLTGADRGFVADAPPEARAEAVAAWQAWLKER